MALAGCLLIALVVAVGPAGVSTAASSDPYPLSPTGPVLPSNGAWFGGYSTHIRGGDETGDDALMAFEDLIGRKQAVKRAYHSWNDVFPNDDERWVRDRGTTLILSWTSSSNGVVQAYWRDIANGRYDSLIDARADDIKAFGAPMFFTFHHEPDSGEPSTGTPQDFVAAWKHIHDRFDADGVTNVTWVLILLSYTYMNGGADEWYPGDEYVDMLGADGYNWFTCPPGVWKSFEEIFQAFHDYGVTKHKPELIGEWASVEQQGVPGSKAAWFADAEAILKTWPEIKALSYYNEGTENGAKCDWWVDTTPSSLAAFKAIGADPWFNPPPPLVTVDSRPPDLDDRTTTTFVFHSNILGSTFTCTLNSGNAKVCVSPYLLSNLPQGDNQLKITATDPLSGSSNATIESWTVDSIAPVASILTGPVANTHDTSATFQLDSTEEDNGSFTCSLDGAPAEACTRWTTYDDLQDGDHELVATAIDEAGNESAPVTWDWTVDTVAPLVKITSGPPSQGNSNTATFTFVSNEDGVTFKCSLDGGTYFTCDSPKTYNWIPDGTHTFDLTALDLAKNLSATVDWTWTVG
jgi:Glycosyl hydrolase family 26